MTRRVVNSGYGTVSPVGNCVQESWQSLINGCSEIDVISKFDTEGFPVKVAGEVELNIDEWLESKTARRLNM
ncbi:beta-ketoacyl synthase N-terminal-like domain-containing protein [Aliikangiella sp. G2MR2-5]|uniref:beta-ketoacyl synthase N-terminal-like domain-containing protein n=1 Tax=Aliikangiella sp. G2MR2-5 TaxID=2788943 RepID=UPI0018AB9475|nr:beta-ketoacyl synthase N-terminal-like domain-containing protein [Aliikangiella sp. G2MR2-5]